MGVGVSLAQAAMIKASIKKQVSFQYFLAFSAITNSISV
jgi:hypothetical protein